MRWCCSEIWEEERYWGALADFSYESTANYVGEIKIVLKVGTHDITYTRSYDFYGSAIGAQPDVQMQMHTKPYAYMDPSKSALVSGEKLDVRKYDNTINVDTTLAVDAGRVNKIKEEYSVGEGGIREE